MRLSHANCVKMILATVCLHNFLILEAGQGYIEDAEVSSDDEGNGQAGEGELVPDTTVQEALKNEFQHPRYNHFARRGQRMADRARRG